jgi:hypothetical protein
LKLYWTERKGGQRLVLENDEGESVEMGAVRETKRGFDAFATTNTYDPSRAQRGIGSMDDAKIFVESHRPWELVVGPAPMEVEPEVRPAEDS